MYFCIKQYTRRRQIVSVMTPRSPYRTTNKETRQPPALTGAAFWSYGSSLSQAEEGRFAFGAVFGV